MIKAISFDLWGTLIKSNPEFKKARAEFISQKYNLPENEVNQIISQMKWNIDVQVERHGVSFETDHLYQILNKSLGWNTNKEAYDLRKECEKIFLNYPPLFFSETTKDALRELSDKFDLHLLSNKVLIDGNILEEMFDIFEIKDYFENLNFSSNLKVSKPNVKAFQYAHQFMPYVSNEVLHVGDNKKCDYNGAINYGFNAILINQKTKVSRSSNIPTSPGIEIINQTIQDKWNKPNR